MIPYHIIASLNADGIIGIENNLLIECKDDLKRFYQLTTAVYPESSTRPTRPKNILIMGYNTWLSIPESVKPFKGRMSIVVSRLSIPFVSSSVMFLRSMVEAFTYCERNQTGRVFVIGGSMIFGRCLTHHSQYCQNLYLTHFSQGGSSQEGGSKKGYKTFPLELLADTIENYRGPKVDSDCIVNTWGEAARGPEPIQLSQQLIIHQKVAYANKGENQYLQLLQKVLREGAKHSSRNATVYSLFGERMVFDLASGFPLLTTKKMGYKTILRELLWFISGSTDNMDLQDKHVHIWDQNASKEFLESRDLAYEEGDLGPVYGFQWRYAGAEYKGCHEDYGGKGVDQLQKVVDLIRNDPTSRRIMMSAWNPPDLDKMALPPCHVMCQFYVNTETQTLDCQLYQRSGDLFLGVPFNIASYAFLTHILAKITGYKPGKLVHILGDVHLYEDHVEQAKEQLTRVPVAFPTITISEEVSEIDYIQEEMIAITGYTSYPKIEAHMVA